jgi:hypothetical protein
MATARLAALCVPWLLVASPATASPKPSCDRAGTHAPSRLQGADPTGKSDSTAALQKAINAAAGGVLDLPPGHYRIRGLMLPKNGITLRGFDAELRFDGAASRSHVISIPHAASNISIIGLTIDGDRARAADSVNGIQSGGGVRNVFLCALRIANVARNAIVLSSGDQDWEVVANHIVDSGRFGIVVDFLKTPVQRLQVTDNTVNGSGEGSISFIANSGGARDMASAGVWSAVIARNSVEKNGQGISGYSPNNRDILVEDNRISATGDGSKGHAAHWGGERLKILNNVARDTTLSAIMISAWPNANPQPTSTFEVRGNVIERVTSSRSGSGILIQNASRGEVSDNRITGFAASGISITGATFGKSQEVASQIAVLRNRIVGGSTVCDAERDKLQSGISVAFAERISIVSNSVERICAAAFVLNRVSFESWRDNLADGKPFEPRRQ